MIPVKTCQRTDKKSQLGLLVDHTNHEFQLTQQKKLVRGKIRGNDSLNPNGLKSIDGWNSVWQKMLLIVLPVDVLL